MFQIFHTIILNYKSLHLKYDLDKEYNLIIIIDAYDVYPSVYTSCTTLISIWTLTHHTIISNHCNYNIIGLPIMASFLFFYIINTNVTKLITIIILLYKILLLIKINNAKYTLHQLKFYYKIFLKINLFILIPDFGIHTL